MMGLNSTGSIYFVYIAIFLGVLLMFDGLRQLLSREERGDQARNRRMKMLKKGASTSDILNIFLDEKSFRSPGLLGMLNLSRALRQAGLHISVPKLIGGLLAAGGAVFLFALQLYPPLLALGAGLITALALPFLVISHKRTKRIEALTDQLPDALDLMARGLSVGHPISVTVGSVASDMLDPIGTEFGLVQDQVSYGDDIVTAFGDLAERYDIEDLNYLAVSVGIQHGTGGNLGRVLRVLSKVIRDRATMRKRIHAISAEGRLSAFILSALPFVIFGVINTTSPSFYGDVQSDPLAIPFAAAIIFLVLLQATILIRMVNFKF